MAAHCEKEAGRRRLPTDCLVANKQSHNRSKRVPPAASMGGVRLIRYKRIGGRHANEPLRFTFHIFSSSLKMIAHFAIVSLLVSTSFACLPGLGGLGGGCGGAASPCAAPPPPPIACGGGCGAAPYPAGPIATPYLAPAALPPPPPPAHVVGLGAQPAAAVYSAPLPAGNTYVGQGK